MAPVIVAKDLYKRYPGFPPVLKGVDIEIAPGEAAAIMGPSGCGKSTMLHVLGMLHAPDAGSLNILGENVLAFNREQTASFRRSNIGFVMQSNNLFEHSTVFENVEFPLIYDNVPPRERWSRVIRALELVRLTARVHYRSNRLSGGEQQRVAIARAMVNNPRVLLADEPTGALDARTSALIMENFRRLCHEGGVSMVMVTHDPKMAEYCDSIYVLEDGALRVKKHEAPPKPVKAGENLLNPVEPVVRGAVTARRFPNPRDPNLMRAVSRLHNLTILSSIYSLSPAEGSGFGEYALALPTRHMGLFQRFRAYLGMIRGARGSVSLWSLWKKLPAHASADGNFIHQFKAFAFGARLARWALSDNAQFFYAIGARRAATSTWVAASLAKLPFAIAVRGRDIDHFGPDWAPKFASAAFMICSTRPVIEKLRELLPLAPAEKFVLIRDALPVAPEDNDTEPDLPPGKRPAEFLALGEFASREGFQNLLDACASLKKSGVPFSLSLLGQTTFRQRLAISRRGLGKTVTFLGMPSPETIRSAFKNSDIFIAYAPPADNAGLDLPWEISEAMAFSLAIVVPSLSPGMAEALKPDENCVACPKAAELAATLEKLTADPQKRRELGTKARTDILNLLNEAGESRTLGDRVIQIAGLAERPEAEK